MWLSFTIITLWKTAVVVPHKENRGWCWSLSQFRELLCFINIGWSWGKAKTLPRRFMKSRTHIEGYEIKKIQLTLCLNMIVWMWHCRILTENPGSLQSVFSVRNSIRCTHCEKLPEFQFSFPLAQLFGQRTRSPNSSCLKNLPIHLYWKVP